MFTHLHWYSTFSFLEAIGQPSALVNKAKELWMKWLAVTDIGGMYSAIKLYQSAKDAGITPILWVELGFVLDMKWFQAHHKFWNICLLATSYEGYLNLIKIVSVANTEGIDKQAKIDFEVLEKYSKDVKVFFWGLQSWIGKKILENESNDKIVELLQKFIAIFGQDSVFLEVVAQKYSDIPELEKINTTLLELSKQLHLGVIVDNVYQYVNKEDKETWEIALAIKDVKKIYEEDRRRPKWDFSFQSEDDIIATCLANGYSRDEVEWWIATNNSILEQVNIDIDMYQSLFPIHQSPEDIQEKYEKVKDSLIEKK